MIIEKTLESKVVLENGKIRTVFSEEIENNGGWMTVDDFVRLGDAWINKMKEISKNANINK
jgi:hypothetical protein